ncbi:MAG: hypothetical protein ACI9WL_001581 [Rubritalea sp.]|jgi:hypothetical protein
MKKLGILIIIAISFYNCKSTNENPISNDKLGLVFDFRSDVLRFENYQICQDVNDGFYIGLPYSEIKGKKMDLLNSISFIKSDTILIRALPLQVSVSNYPKSDALVTTSNDKKNLLGYKDDDDVFWFSFISNPKRPYDINILSDENKIKNCIKWENVKSIKSFNGKGINESDLIINQNVSQ